MKAPNIPNRRKTGRRTRLGTLILLLAAAQSSPAEVSLTDAVVAAYARQQDGQVAQARRDLGQAMETRASQILAGDPSFNLKYQTDAVGSGNGYREWEGGVDLPLWWPGQRSAQRREAERVYGSADALASARRLTVAGEVRERLWNLALARSSRHEAQLAYDSARALERDIARRVDAGELPRSDLLLAQKETLAREDDLLQARNRARQAQRRFESYTGLSELPAIQAESLADMADLSAQHPKLALVKADVERARARRDRVAAERHSGTSLWLGGKTTRDSSGMDYNSAVGVELSVPFGSRSHAAPALAEAEAALTEAQVSRQRTRLELEGALAAARLEHERAETALQRAVARKSLADESLRLSRRAFELGETDLVRLLQARRDALKAHSEYEMRRLQLGQAVARLNQISGVIPQ